MNTWTEATIRVNGIDIHYWRTGGKKPPIVLSHGLTDNGRCWEPIARALAGEYDLIMPDARGHGRSSAPETGYQTSDRAADLLGLLDALEIPQVVVMGHSMGAETSAWVAATAPERVRAAVLEDPPFRESNHVDPAAVAESWAAGLLAQHQLTHDELVAQGRRDNPSWSPEALDPWAEAKLQTNPRVFSWVADRPSIWREAAARITVPTLLLTGDPERGSAVTPEVAASIAARCPSARLVRIRGAGHCISREQPETYLAAVKAFLLQT